MLLLIFLLTFKPTFQFSIKSNFNNCLKCIVELKRKLVRGKQRRKSGGHSIDRYRQRRKTNGNLLWFSNILLKYY